MGPDAYGPPGDALEGRNLPADEPVVPVVIPSDEARLVAAAKGGGVLKYDDATGNAWTATYTVTAASTEGDNLNVSLTAEDNAGRATETRTSAWAARWTSATPSSS